MSTAAGAFEGLSVSGEGSARFAAPSPDVPWVPAAASAVSVSFPDYVQGLDGSSWDLAWVDLNGNRFTADMTFTDATATAGAGAVSGYFDWVSVGTGARAREYFEAEVTPDRGFTTTSLDYLDRPPWYEGGTYEGLFNRTFTTLEGAWTAPGIVPATFTAVRRDTIEEPTKSAAELFGASRLSVMATAAQAAYDDAAGDRALRQLLDDGWVVVDERRLAGHEIEDSRFVDGRAGVLILEAADSVLVSFRGTDTLGDRVFDWRNMASQWQRLSDTMADLDGYLEDTGKSLHVTGHSLGAGLATAYMGSRPASAHPDDRAELFANPGYVTRPADQFVPRDDPRIHNYTTEYDIIRMARIADLLPGHERRIPGTSEEIAFSLGPVSIQVSPTTSGHGMALYAAAVRFIEDQSLQLSGLEPISIVVDGDLDRTVLPATLLPRPNSIAVQDAGMDLWFSHGVGRDSVWGTAVSEFLFGGPGRDVLHGGRGTDVLHSGYGNDRLVGGPGGDMMLGGPGDDVYLVDSSADRIGEAAGHGRDRVESRVSFTLVDQVEDLTLTGQEGLTGRGNAAANVLTGNGAANVLWGEGGNDVLSSGAGDDVLRGGSGRDSLQGGAGRDILFGDVGADKLSGGLGADTLVGGFDQDDLTGGPGADRFLFRSAEEAGTGGNHDRIMDFSHAAGDRIDLGRIDADETRPGDQAFRFIGSRAFSVEAGELQYRNSVIRADTDGDGMADSYLVLPEAPRLIAADFVL